MYLTHSLGRLEFLFGTYMSVGFVRSESGQGHMSRRGKGINTGIQARL